MLKSSIPVRLIKALRRYFDSMGIPKHIKDRVVAFFRKNFTHRGPTGLAILLKGIGNTLRLWLRARQKGNSALDMPKQVKGQVWITKTISGFPKLFDGLQEFPYETLERLTKIHKLVKPNELSSKANGAVKAISSEIDSRIKDAFEAPKYEISAFKEACRLISLSAKKVNVKPYKVRSVWKPSKANQSVDHAFHMIEAMGRWGHPGTPYEEILGTRFCPFPIDDFLAHPAWVNTKSAEPFGENGLVGGTYEISHEAGCKARCYFNVDPMLNSMLEPLYKGLEYFERNSGKSVRYLDIHDRIKPVQDWMASGKTVWSIDQSSATDRFPLSLQKYFLHVNGVDPIWIRLVSKVCSLPYVIQDELRHPAKRVLGLSEEPTTLVISCGQPMGATFSMPLYTSTFIALLEGACIAWGWNPEFLVLGDDLVVTDPNLAAWVSEFLPKLGVAISPNKGVVSDQVAEFVGATILEDSYVFPGTWPIPSKTNWYEISKSCNKPFDYLGVKDKERLRRAYGFGRLSELAFRRADDADDILNLPPTVDGLTEDDFPFYGSHTPPHCPIDLNRDNALGELSEEFGIGFDEHYTEYNTYRRNRLIRTLQGFSKKLQDGTITSYGTWLDRLYSRRFWDHDDILDWIPDFEGDAFVRITATMAKIFLTVGEDLTPSAGRACMSYCKAHTHGRDHSLGESLGHLSEWLIEFSTILVPVKKKYPVHAMDLLFADIEGFVAELHGMLTAKKPEGYKADKEHFNALVAHFLNS